ncbi:YciI family protein [uncultured Mucilaginibacter sp.]|uniref:YciI family protein n=1 Tax=uncultured Mucilaginibacter sp. TaxID=797541 RepID=UPI0025FF7989|nr:YciI family protein [uncultured Mucilaginibacter sp.]
MKQYVVTAYDFTDNNALNRRLEARPAHLKGVKVLKQNNNFIAGGAILNEQDQMVGSVMIVQFETEHLMQQWLKNDPYVMGQVWEKIDVKPFKQAIV